MSDLSDIAFCEAKIAALYGKLGKARGDLNKFYYRACIRGWQTTLDRLRAKQ